MELIPEALECDRCLDLLFGAAYAMGYTFTRVANRTLYLIAPQTVNVETYASLNDLTQRDNAGRWPGSDPSNPMDGSWQRVPQPGSFAQQGVQTGYHQTGFNQTGYNQTGYNRTGYGQTGYNQPMSAQAGGRFSNMTNFF